jgi:cold shock protein
VSSRETGEIKVLRDSFGFVSRSGGRKDAFFHLADIGRAAFHKLSMGTKVSFNVEDGPKGPRASGLEILAV